MINTFLLLLIAVLNVYNTKKQRKIMSTQQEIADGLVTLKGQVTKIAGETTGLKDKVKALEDALNNPDQQVTPALQAAFDDIKVGVQTVDDLVTDVTVPTGEPGTGEQPTV